LKPKKSWFYAFGYHLIGIFIRPAFRLKVSGIEHVPKEGGVILCCNHASFLDPPAVGVSVSNRQIWFMARDTLFRNPLFGRLIKAWHAFPVKRGSTDRAAWKHFEDLVAGGEAVLFFPEGTRSPDGNLQEPKAGSGMLIYRCPAVSVVPVRIFGSDRALPRGSFLPRLFRQVKVSFGPVLDLTAEKALPAERETYQKIAAKVMEAISRLTPPE
jgi:1-acyl-sn-glycerol-3-phosphate acyltransferase